VARLTVPLTPILMPVFHALIGPSVRCAPIPSSRVPNRSTADVVQLPMTASPATPPNHETMTPVAASPQLTRALTLAARDEITPAAMHAITDNEAACEDRDLDESAPVFRKLGLAAAESVAAIVARAAPAARPVQRPCARPVPALGRIGQPSEPRLERRCRSNTGWGGWGSNPGPTGYEPAALTS
jgi:hypothetical protein